MISERLGHTSVAFSLQRHVHSRRRTRRAAAWGTAQLFARDSDETGQEQAHEGAAEAASATSLPHAAKNEKDAV